MHRHGHGYARAMRLRATWAAGSGKRGCAFITSSLEFIVYWAVALGVGGWGSVLVIAFPNVDCIYWGIGILIITKYVHLGECSGGHITLGPNTTSSVEPHEAGRAVAAALMHSIDAPTVLTCTKTSIR